MNNAIIRRLREGSTQGGFAALALAAKAFWPEHSALLDSIAMICGALAVAIPERGGVAVQTSIPLK